MTASSLQEKTNRKLEISFGGCGFLGVYHVGVGKCVVDHVPHLFDEFSGFYGASAGAITAVCAACKSDPMVPYKWVKKTFEASREHKLLGTLHPSFDLYARLREFLEGFLPENAHKLSRNKVKISLTIFNEEKTIPEPKNWLVTNFTTRNELINAIVASSFIPGYAGLKDFPKIRGKRCCDGGFTSNIPCGQDPNVITVSPFSGECDICPPGESHSPHLLHVVDQSLQLSTRNILRLMKALVPTSWTDLEELFYNGYKDAYRFFKLEGIISEALVRPVRRRSTVDGNVATAKNSNGAAAINSNTTISENEERDDLSSDYYSQCSDVAMCHQRQCSITVSINGDFFSCLSDDEGERGVEGEGEGEDEGVGGEVSRDHGGSRGGGGGGGRGKVPSYLRTLWREMDQIMSEIERDTIEHQLSSSWSRLKQYGVGVVQRCSPTRLPLVRSIVGNRGNKCVAETTDDITDEEYWDSELKDHPRILHSIITSWTSSMTIM